jgi:tetratricopeptide (TPR) repeat protein
MFFPRLRSHAKWAFMLMIVVFAGGFVFLGVGSGGLDLGSLIQDTFGRGSSSAPGVSEALKKVNENPRNAAAQKQLATAYETKGQLPEAISAYQQYIALRPKDASALAHLAGLQATQADNYLTAAQNAFVEQQSASAGSIFGVAPTTKFGKALGTDPISNLIQTQTGTAAQQANSQYTAAAQQAISTYKKLTKLQPTQENLITLASTAQRFQDTKTATAAYRKVLKLTDDATLKAQIRAQIKALQASSTASGGG